MAKVSNDNVVNLPFYAKASLIVLGLFVFVHMMSVGKSIIVPLLFAVVISILLSAAVDFLEKKKVDRTLAISLTLLMTLILGAVLIMWIISRANIFIDALPELNVKLDVLQKEFAGWISENFGVGARKTNDWINTARADLTTMSSDRIGDTISTLANSLIILILVPVYIFLILYYQPLIIDFIHRIVGHGFREDVGIVLNQSKTLLKAYFVGLLVELVVMVILNAIGYLALGVEYAFLLAIIGAILNMIPYIGGIIMLGLSMLMAMLSNTDPKFALYAAAVFFVIQIIDNYFLIPKIVGSKIKINALVAVVVVIAGGAIWGIAGMFLSLPLIAIIKVIFDRIEPLEPWGFLFGDTMPPMVRIKFRGRKKVTT
ncbi:MAG: AI-2E family transporter [Bacteroidota bacterium]|nr:AI-2E family transporter [Bacteroidota bacterium]